jgi:hypothetical protein
MRFPPGYYQIERALGERLGHLRPAQRRGLALWVARAILEAATLAGADSRLATGYCGSNPASSEVAGAREASAERARRRS